MSDFGVKSNNNSIVNSRGLSQIVNSIQKSAPSGDHPSERKVQWPALTLLAALYSGHLLQFGLYQRNRLPLEIEHYMLGPRILQLTGVT